MTPSLLDLFGEIPVSLPEVEIWIDVVPGLLRTHSAWRRENYARCWDVPAKIRAAKASGYWSTIEAAKRDQLAGVGA